MLTYERMQEEYDLLDTKTKQIHKELNELPQGNLVCHHGKNCVKWYRSYGSNNEYIYKRNRVLAEQLARKKYLTFLLQDIEEEKKAMSYYLRKHNKDGGKAQMLQNNIPGYRDLLSGYNMNYSNAVKRWLEEPYEANPYYPEQLVHLTKAGFYVRSKSEGLIVAELLERGIPFKYEAPLVLSGELIYPDFTIMHPYTGELYYFEHFGIMDEPYYRNNFQKKIALYTNNGIYPGMNLIMTFETKKHPLTYITVDTELSKFFEARNTFGGNLL